MVWRRQSWPTWSDFRDARAAIHRTPVRRACTRCHEHIYFKVYLSIVFDITFERCRSRRSTAEFSSQILNNHLMRSRRSTDTEPFPGSCRGQR